MLMVGIFSEAELEESAEIDDKASKWWPPRGARACNCKGCGAPVGWAFEDNDQEKVGPFFALITSRLKSGTTAAEE